MTDRVTVFPASIPQDTDLLQTNKNSMLAIGGLVSAVVGNTTWCDGLACTQTSVPSLAVSVGPGTLGILSTVDNNPYGSLAADSAPLVKMGQNTTATILNVAAPVTTGQSVVYLIEASFSESDANFVTLPYYNAANPSQPFTGPNNTGTAQATSRIQRVALQAKAGTPAATGSQVAPTVDSGWVGLYTVTVAFGQTSAINSNISQLSTAPFVKGKLANQVVTGSSVSDNSTALATSGWVQAMTQASANHIGVDTGATNALVINLTPAPASLAAILASPIIVKIANTNTGACTLNLNGLGVQNILTNGLSALSAGMLIAGSLVMVAWDGTQFQLASASVKRVNKVILTITATGNFTWPAGVYQVKSTVVGGGAGGGYNSVWCSGGGGSGGRSIKICSATPQTVTPVTIGAGGIAPLGGGAGGTGGTSSFGTFCSATGGGGGSGGAGNANAGGGPGFGSGGDYNDYGQCGGDSIPLGNRGGDGGGPGGGRGTTNFFTGISALGFGGGGGGGGSSAPNGGGGGASGGNGFQGVCILEYELVIG